MSASANGWTRTSPATRSGERAATSDNGAHVLATPPIVADAIPNSSMTATMSSACSSIVGM